MKFGAQKVPTKITKECKMSYGCSLTIIWFCIVIAKLQVKEEYMDFQADGTLVLMGKGLFEKK